jgi:hypothetical protein
MSNFIDSCTLLIASGNNDNRRFEFQTVIYVLYLLLAAFSNAQLFNLIVMAVTYTLKRHHIACLVILLARQYWREVAYPNVLQAFLHAYSKFGDKFDCELRKRASKNF